MTKISCDREKGGCGCHFEIDEEKVDKKLKWAECPFCRSLSLNPFYEEEGE